MAQLLSRPWQAQLQQPQQHRQQQQQLVGICAHMTGAMGTGGHTVGVLGEWRLLREWAAGGWLRRGQLDVEPQGGTAGLGWARV